MDSPGLLVESDGGLGTNGRLLCFLDESSSVAGYEGRWTTFFRKYLGTTHEAHPVPVICYHHRGSINVDAMAARRSEEHSTVQDMPENT